MARAMTRGEIAEVLRRWQAGQLTAEQVHTWADDLYFPGHLEFDDREGEDEGSVANEVLSSLSMLDMNLVTAADVPIYLEFLSTPPGQFADGYRRFVEAMDRIDREERRRSLSQTPPYTPYCGGG